MAIRRASPRASATRLLGVRRREGFDVAVGVFEQPEPELRIEHAADALVDHGFVEQSVADGRGEAGHVAERAWELHVEPGLQRLNAGVGRVNGGSLSRGQRVHRAVVGDGQAAEAECAPEHVGEEAS